MVEIFLLEQFSDICEIRDLIKSCRRIAYYPAGIKQVHEKAGE